MSAFIIGMINLLIKGLGAILILITSVLPPSPFSLIDNSPIQPYLSGINWLIPVSSILAIGEAWLTAIGTYYIYQVVARWLKVIE